MLISRAKSMQFMLLQKTDGNCCFTKLLQVQGEENSNLVGPSQKVQPYKDVV